MTKSKDKFDENDYKKCNAIFEYRMKYFLEDNDVETEAKNTVQALIKSIKKGNDYEADSNDYEDCFEIKEKININGKEYDVIVTYGKKKKKPLFLDIIKDDGTFNAVKYDYFFKFKGQKKGEKKCPICEHSSGCIVEVKEEIEHINNQKVERAYLTSICNNKKNIKQAVEEKKLRVKKLKKPKSNP